MILTEADPEHPEPKQPKVTWLSPFFDLWQQQFPGSNPPMGEWAKNLAPLIQLHGRAEVLVRWGRMVAAKPASVGSAALLAKGWTEFAQDVTVTDAAAFFRAEAAKAKAEVETLARGNP